MPAVPATVPGCRNGYRHPGGRVQCPRRSKQLAALGRSRGGSVLYDGSSRGIATSQIRPVLSGSGTYRVAARGLFPLSPVRTRSLPTRGIRRHAPTSAGSARFGRAGIRSGLRALVAFRQMRLPRSPWSHFLAHGVLVRSPFREQPDPVDPACPSCHCPTFEWAAVPRIDPDPCHPAFAGRRVSPFYLERYGDSRSSCSKSREPVGS